MSVIWNTDGIGARLAQLRGERPNGTYYVKQPDGGYANQPRHEINLADRCVRCGATAIDIEDSIVPAFCTGRIDGEACIHCGARAVVPSGRDQVMCIACRAVSYRDESASLRQIWRPQARCRGQAWRWMRTFSTGGS